jgi:hypothetical protein
MSAPISGKGSDVATREQAAGASARRARQRAGRTLIGSLDGSGGPRRASSATMDLVLENTQAREPGIKDRML